jgi:hypothetical protein
MKPSRIKLNCVRKLLWKRNRRLGTADLRTMKYEGFACPLFSTGASLTWVWTLQLDVWSHVRTLRLKLSSIRCNEICSN